MGKYVNMRLSDLRKQERGLFGNLLLAKLEAQLILHQNQNYIDENENIVEPIVTEYFEKEVELTVDAFIIFLTNEKIHWTIAELKASVELEKLFTTGNLGIKTLVKNVKSPTPTSYGGVINGQGTGAGEVVERLDMKKDGGSHGGSMRAVGHAYVGENDIVPDSDTREIKNNFTKVKLYKDKIPKELLK